MSVPAGQFFIGQYETATADDEMLVEVRIPVAPKSQGWGFHEVNVRKGDFAIVAAATTLQMQQGKVQAVSIALAGVDPMRSVCRRPKKRLSAEKQKMRRFARPPRPAPPQSILTRIFTAPRNTAEISPGPRLPGIARRARSLQLVESPCRFIRRKRL